ncbi:hypothetical protein N2605_26895 [Bradyrhizobium yuanmingense]|uniref:hypothetical protein n=1 Tax=Bradyrhizobium yuanmingense TaxID=108015 RepID=UPI0021A79114|nr:hypothetical protein [Bradyrhizobium sp. CB1024]UWU83152.1 hypothetical protein N2605_26895 [Bradyrhizobium sp. CB1024]
MRNARSGGSPSAPELDRSLIFVFKQNDFESAIASNVQLANYWFQFRFMLERLDFDPATAAQLYAGLCATPEIAEALRRRQAQQPKTPPADGCPTGFQLAR